MLARRRFIAPFSIVFLMMASIPSQGSIEPATLPLNAEEIIYQGQTVDGTTAAASVVFRLGIQTNGVTMSVCTMTAIAKDILLTAAHCQQPGRDLVLLAYDPKTGNPAHIPVRRFIQHPRYQQRKGDNGDENTHDVALVKLARPLDLKQFALIPEPGYRIPTDTKVTTFGYGLNGTQPTQQELLARPEVRALVEEMKKPGLTDEAKQKLYARLLFVAKENPLLRAETTARLEQVKFAVTPILLLQSKNPLCGGDSGGPTFLSTQGKLIQVGVHSLSQNGDNCDKGRNEYLWGILKGENLRSWDAYVPFYADWIKQEADRLRAEKEI